MPDTVIAASLTLDGKQANQSVASFKAELRAAQQDVISLTNKFGATSDAARDAAKRAAELKDRIADSKKLVDSFNPDEKFRGFTQVLTGVAGGFSAITGAMGLLGIQSEDVQKQLLKVQSALAITQGLNSIGDSIQSFKNLGATLVNTLGKGGLIGIAIAGVAALSAAFLDAFLNAEELTKEQKTLEAVSKKAGEQYADERIKLDALVEVAKDETATRRDRQEAVDKLQKTYPNYLSNIKLEKDGVTGLEAGYLKLVKSIELKATADAASQLATETLKVALKEGLKFGITSFEDLEKVKKSLENNSSFVAKQVLNQINAAQSSYDQLKGIAAKANEQIAQLGGDPTGGGGEKEEAARKAFLASHTLVGGVWFTNEELKQAIEDAKIRTQVAAGAITGKVGEGIEIPKSAEQLQFEAEAKARHDIRIQDEADLARNIVYKKGISDENIRLSQEQVDAEEAATTAKIGFAQAIQGVLTGISGLFGRQTAASKIAALADIAIGTGVGFINALKIAQQTAAATGPAAAFAFPIFYATQIAAVLAAAARAKSILGSGGGGGGTASVAAPSLSIPQAPLAPQAQVSTTRLDQQSINSTNNATVRAYTLESDGADATERRIRLNRAARLGG